MDLMQKLKTFLGIKDNLQDDLLESILEVTQDHFRAITGGVDTSDVEFIILEVAIKRYNRVGSEGYSSQTVEGHRLDFSTSDFDEYKDILKRKYPQAFDSGGVKFI
ncbi:Phage gp6-like head-tail connector protein [Alloiococcus otitis]|uniref:Phage head-tail connector protein n=1 Tax=Alloiococcus otitis ATCC 51267 TaxID=883081 RepID=K9EAL0_9LACT|nr:phage head-tail connector protein [Alloiococcus otitis]EKU92856.1 hypothetical protein HMPREF9698_01609 [Alloiococcus otitis ATCC 51267]SUU91678.1 Phage gp6-like head-tail connector protein [Alloiococcus otitis]SUU91731.1 Phage gp6-like head-tail connector protein [Alloiococcus otitis]